MVSFRDVGDGSPSVIFLNGNFCTIKTWERAMLHLTDRGMRSVAIDYLRSERPWGGWSASGVADMTRDLMDVLEVNRAVVVGHSFGGISALVFALRYPNRTAGIGLVATGATTEGQTVHGQLVQRLRRSDLDREQLCETYNGFWAERPSEHLVEEAVNQLTKVRPEAFREALESAGRLDLRPQLPLIECPALVCRGLLDEGRKKVHADQLVAGLRKVSLHEFDTGHMIPLEDPAGFNLVLATFADEFREE